MKSESRQTRAENITLRLRQMILNGEFPPGTHLAEIPLSERLGVSRSPVRLALGVLEHEGLLRSEPRRGFVVRNITIAEIADSFEVRACLEALACRQAVERGIDSATKVALQECIDEGRALVDKGRLSEDDPAVWSTVNGRFHAALLRASRNEPLIAAYEFNAARPLVSASAIAFNIGSLDVSYRNMVGVQAEHEAIVKALWRRDLAVAEHLVREHAANSRAKLMRVLEAVHAQRQAQTMPGVKLLVG